VIIGNATDEPPAEPGAASVRPTAQRTWAMPKSPVTRKQVDYLGRLTIKAGAGLTAALADLARAAGRAVKAAWLAMSAVPPPLRLLAVLGVLTLLGIVGSIALTDTRKLFCAIVIVPACSVAIGALAHRWVSRPGDPDTNSDELARSVAYVDTKLTAALNALGTERHQQAVIALIQAKTAADLALGATGDTDAPLPVDDLRRRPRIQAGTSLAAS
jgi:hypothetical protein